MSARVQNIIVFVAFVVIATIATVLHADPSGHSTHTQLGLAPCAFLRVTGIPCLFCGMTTAFVHAAHFSIAPALRAQPAGAILFVVMVIVGLASAREALRAAPRVPLARLECLLEAKPWILPAVGAILGFSWVYRVGMTLVGRPS